MNRFRLCFLLFLVYMVYGCSQRQDSPDQDITVISGHVASTDDQLAILSLENSFVASTEIEDGMFFLEVPKARSGYYALSVADRQIPLFVAPDFHVNLALNNRSDTHSIRFQGRGKEVNQYLSAEADFKSNNEPDWDTLWDQSKKEFSDRNNRYRIKSEAFLDNYLARNSNLDPRFIERERARILYAWVNRMMVFDDRVLAGGVDGDVFMGKGLFDFIPGVSMEDPDLLLLPEYKEFLKKVIHRLSKQESSQDGQSQYALTLDFIDQEIFEEEIRNFLAFQVMKEYLQNGGDEQVEMMNERFRAICKDGGMLAEIRKALEYAMPSKDGRQVAQFSGTDILGSPVTVESLRGHIVYLDVWASWCQGCIKNVAVLDSLRTQFRSEDVLFVSLSLDEDPMAWRSFLSKYAPGGIQILDKTGWNSKVRTRYLIESVPRYMLIDRKGMIVNSDAPPPSNPEIIHQIKALLETS